MPKPYEPPFGPWYRFDRYEISGGYIRPAPGAVLEGYDPWEAYVSATNGQGAEVAPYQPLLQLIENLEIERDDESGTCWIAPERVGDLLAWCAAHGLLGVLLHHAQIVVLAPRWRYAIGDARLPVPMAIFRRCVRVGGRWVEASPVYFDKSEMRKEDGGTAPKHMSDGGPIVRTSLSTLAKMVGSRPKSSKPRGARKEGELVELKDIPDDRLKPGVFLEDLEGLEYRHESLSQTWARFFPDVPEDERETYPYPLPTDAHFWRQYAEPLDVFLDAALRLRHAILELSEWKDPPQGEFEPGELRDTIIEIRRPEEKLEPGWAGGLDLNALVAGVSRRVEPAADGTIRERWVSPSLLATFAMMALQDLSEQGRVLQCANCNKLFVTKAYQAAYCSKRCRNTAQKRKYRQKQREIAKSKGGRHV